MALRNLTVEALLSARCCYPRERIEAIFDGRVEMTPQDVASSSVPRSDRVWAIASCCMDEREARLFACDCVLHVLDSARYSSKLTLAKCFETIGSATAYAVLGSKATKKEMDDASARMNSIAWYVQRTEKYDQRRDSVLYAAAACASPDAVSAIYLAQSASGYPPTERIWQLRRALEY